MAVIFKEVNGEINFLFDLIFTAADAMYPAELTLEASNCRSWVLARLRLDG